MNILFITHYSGMYGANKSLLQLILELRKDYNVQPMVLLRNEGEICEELRKENIPYIVSHYYWWVNEDRGLFKKLLNKRKQIINLCRIPNIARQLQAYKIDLIYTNSICVNIGIFLKKRLKVPHIWHFRESLYQFRLSLSLSLPLSSYLCKKGADRYILISDYLCEYYQFLLPKDKVRKIYNGINFSNVQIRENRLENDLHLCMAGIVSEQKNQMDALKAVHFLVDKHRKRNIKLHIIGGHKVDYLAEMQKYIKDNGLQDFVIFHGHQTDVSDILREMNIGLMCSRDEAFGRVTIEYMMHSMPVIASISGANAEIVKKETGFLYEIYNTRDLADKILSFIENPISLQTMGKTAYEYAKENFSSRTNTKLIYEQINELIK